MEYTLEDFRREFNTVKPCAPHCTVSCSQQVAMLDNWRAPQTVRAGEQTFQFDVDPDIKERLLNGLDEIALTLQHEADITAYERARAYPGPSTAAL